MWDAKGIGIGDPLPTLEAEYGKLFKRPNWREYWKESRGEIPDIDALLDELDREKLSYARNSISPLPLPS